jgi:putative hemolysin
MQILQNALDFSKIKARDCMVPRPELIAMNIEMEVEQLHSLFVKTGISKILIYRDNIDNIIGYVHSFDMFRKPTAINQVLRSISFVPSAIPAKELLEIFTKRKSNIAVVVDEYGGTAGVITIEDIIEEIFGDIEDEHDVEEWLEEKISEHEYRFSGRVEIDYLNETYHLNFDESEEYETLGGLIIHQLETLPEAGTEVDLGHYKLFIEEVSDRRIEVVKLVIEE